MDLYPGMIVYSVAGRDKGKYFIVISVIENYVEIVDGKIRRLEKPKRKKMKHIKSTQRDSLYIMEKIQGNRKLTNVDIKKSLRDFLDSTTINGE